MDTRVSMIYYGKLNHRLAALPALPAQLVTGQESIAVLPFKVLISPLGEHWDEYLGVGLADALITRLSNVQRLIVRPTGSVLRYRGAVWLIPVWRDETWASTISLMAVCSARAIACALWPNLSASARARRVGRTVRRGLDRRVAD